MADKKSLTRTFEAELRKLPVELVPPDPAGLHHPSHLRQASAQANPPTVLDAERGVLDRLIDRIKQI
jgi:hypothetical protein